MPRHAWGSFIIIIILLLNFFFLQKRKWSFTLIGSLANAIQLMISSSSVLHIFVYFSTYKCFNVLTWKHQLYHWIIMSFLSPCPFKRCVSASSYELTPCHVMCEARTGKNELVSRRACARSSVRTVHSCWQVDRKRSQIFQLLLPFRKLACGEGIWHLKKCCRLLKPDQYVTLLFHHTLDSWYRMCHILRFTLVSGWGTTEPPPRPQKKNPLFVFKSKLITATSRCICISHLKNSFTLSLYLFKKNLSLKITIVVKNCFTAQASILWNLFSSRLSLK